MDITDKCLLVRFCFTTLNNRDLNESVKKTTYYVYLKKELFCDMIVLE